MFSIKLKKILSKIKKNITLITLINIKNINCIYIYIYIYCNDGITENYIQFQKQQKYLNINSYIRTIH